MSEPAAEVTVTGHRVSVMVLGQLTFPPRTPVNHPHPAVLEFERFRDGCWRAAIRDQTGSTHARLELAADLVEFLARELAACGGEARPSHNID